MPEVITDNLDLWTSALLSKATAGRGSNGKLEAYGIKKLRELILELAVRGKLVPQDPNDEPASELLKHIQAEKAKLVAEGKIKKGKPLPEIGEDEKPFDLPTGWEWVRLGEIGGIGSSSRVHQRDWASSGVPFYRAREIVKLSNSGCVDNELFISEELYESLSKDGLVPEFNDLMITGVGTIGIPYIVKQTDRFYFKDASVLIFKNYYGLFAEFLSYFMKSPYWVSNIHAESMGTTVHTLTIGRANEVPTALPPFAEQHRIVAKVDELLALCDQLEQQQTDSLAAHQTLVEALLGTLTRVESQQEFGAAWARIASHFDTLFTTEASIDQLKQTILELAVRGKLVAQDSNDEPASVSLERAEEEKANLVKQGKIRKQKELPPIAEDEMPFQLPVCWSVVRLGAVSHLITKGTTPTSLGYAYVDSGIAFIKVENIDRGRIQGATISEYIDEQTDVALQRSRLQESDVLFSIAGTIGKTCIVHEEDLPANTNQALAIIRGTSAVFDTRYLLIQLDSYVAEATRSKARGGAMPNVSLGDLTVLVLPVPPLAEQHRIVAKVDELVALCDALKSRLADAQTTKIHLADAIVEQAIC